MAICPKCNEEIDGLDHQKENYGDCYVWLEGDELEFEITEHNDKGAGSYTCPYCSEDLATTEEEAIKLLTPTEEERISHQKKVEAFHRRKVETFRCRL